MNFRSLLLLGVLPFLFSCDLNKEQKLSFDVLEIEFLEAFREVKTINLVDLNPNQWDSVVILLPYTDVEGLSQDIGIDLSELNYLNMQVRDDIGVLVFIQDKKIAGISIIEQKDFPIEFDSDRKILIDRNIQVSIQKASRWDHPRLVFSQSSPLLHWGEFTLDLDISNLSLSE